MRRAAPRILLDVLLDVGAAVSFEEFSRRKGHGIPRVVFSRPKACRVHLGNRAIRCIEESRRRQVSRIPGREPGAGDIVLVKMPRTSLDARTPWMPERS